MAGEKLQCTVPTVLRCFKGLLVSLVIQDRKCFIFQEKETHNEKGEPGEAGARGHSPKGN